MIVNAATAVLPLLALAASAAPTVWTPVAGTTWQISLSQTPDTSGTLSPDVTAYDYDMYSMQNTATISNLHAKGKKVICYFSAGSYEPGRPDSNDFQASDMGNPLDGWPNEKWLNINSANVRSIMTKRIQLASSMGCDAVDPDNVDGYSNDNGLGLTQADAADYVNFLATTASANNIAIGLKNAGGLIPQVINNVQFSINEQCHQYSECNLYQPFIAANKPVFNIEYPSGAENKALATETAAYCDSVTTNSEGFATLIKTLDLGTWVQECPIVGIVASTGSVATLGASTATSSSTFTEAAAPTTVKTFTSATATATASATTTSSSVTTSADAHTPTAGTPTASSSRRHRHTRTHTRTTSTPVQTDTSD